METSLYLEYEANVKRAEVQAFGARCDWEDALIQLGLPCVVETVRERIQRGRRPTSLSASTYSPASLPYLAIRLIDLQAHHAALIERLTNLTKESAK